jgi:ribosome biogenesis GTPase
MIKGRVVRNTGSHYIVETTDGLEVSCKVKGNFRLKGIRTTNPVAVGDNVELADAPDKKDQTTYIKAIEPRRNYIIRRASNLSKESHIIAANIDCAMLVITLAHPETSTTFIDRFLATAEAYNVNAIIVINKIDLLTEPDDRELLDAVSYLYTSIGYKVLSISAKDEDGIDKLRDEIAGKTVLLSGNSGVGKSTIINKLIPGIELRTAEISAVHDTGMHTTTFSELYHLPGDNAGDIIDTPGIRGFGTIDFDKYEVAHYFREIFQTSQDCRFGNCTHTHEPGCAVIAAVDEQRIAQSRYNSYLSILDDNTEDKYRKGY